MSGDPEAALRDQRDRTLAQIASLTRDFDQMVAASEHSNADDEHDPDGATIGFERAQVAALLAQARRRLDDVERALGQLHDGGYGVCERCGEAIPAERLAARPSTRTCVRCATR